MVGYMGGGPTDGIYVGVRYDSEFGYPVSIEALWETEGGRAEIADEEEIRVRSLQP